MVYSFTNIIIYYIYLIGRGLGWVKSRGLGLRRRARNGAFDGKIPVLLRVIIKPWKLCCNKKKNCYYITFNYKLWIGMNKHVSKCDWNKWIHSPFGCGMCAATAESEKTTPEREVCWSDEETRYGVRGLGGSENNVKFSLQLPLFGSFWFWFQNYGPFVCYILTGKRNIMK